MDVNKLALSNLKIGQTDPKEEWVNMIDSLIPPPITKAPGRDSRKEWQWQTIQSGEEKTAGRGEVHSISENVCGTTQWRGGEQHRVRLFRLQLLWLKTKHLWTLKFNI